LAKIRVPKYSERTQQFAATATSTTELNINDCKIVLRKNSIAASQKRSQSAIEKTALQTITKHSERATLTASETVRKDGKQIVASAN
jgi:hypothetical protein